MSSADRNFGLRPRSGRGAGRGNPRQQTHANPWTRVPDNTAPGTHPVASLPAQHGNITNKFTTFCTIALGYPKNKPPPPKAALLRLFFGIIRTGDSSIAILLFNSASQENAICAPAHVPTTPAALGIYCPEFTHYLKRYRTKCRITSKVPLWMIKSKIFSELRANDFWINPTSIKCKDTEKCGYFLYAHPFMTQQLDFRRILDPILHEDWGKNDNYEYDFQAEKLTITFNGQSASTKVFLLRSSPAFTGKLQQTLLKIFAENTTVELGTLHRYKFIPLTSTAVVSDEMQLGLLRSQQAFNLNVFIYVCHNVHTIDQEFELKETPESTENTPTPEEIQYSYSLRKWFYDLEDSDSSNLIHAVYNTNEENTIKVLCARSKRFLVLQILHDLPTLIQDYFPNEAFKTYFPTPESTPFTVDKFPKVSASCETYAGELATYTTGNPQSDISTSDQPASYVSAAATTAPSTKRTRQGDPKTSPTAAADAQTTDTSATMKAIQEAQARLTNLQNANNANESTITAINSTLTTLTGRITGSENAIKQLADTQVQQSHLLTQLTNKQTHLETNLLTLCRHFDLPVQETPPPPSLPPSQPPSHPKDSNNDVEMQDRDGHHLQDQEITQPSPQNPKQQQNNLITQPELPGGSQGGASS